MSPRWIQVFLHAHQFLLGLCDIDCTWTSSRGCPMDCRVLSSMPGLHSLEARGSPPSQPWQPHLRTHPSWHVTRWKEKGPSESWHSDIDNWNLTVVFFGIFFKIHWLKPSSNFHSLFRIGWALISPHLISSYQILHIRHQTAKSKCEMWAARAIVFKQSLKIHKISLNP